MRRKIGAVVVSVASAVAVGGVTIMGAIPAQAASACTQTQHKEIPTPGFDTDLYVALCVSSGGSGGDVHAANISMSWMDGGSSSADGNRKFDKLRVYQRLERYDAIYAENSCSFAGVVNTSSTNVGHCTYSPTFTSSLNGGWSADGVVEYDIDRDGKGSFYWNLKGTPLIN